LAGGGIMMPHHDAAARNRTRPRPRWVATWIAAAVAVGLWILAPTAAAHGLDLFVTVGGDEIRGLAYFADGARARDVSARLLVGGAVVAETATDAEGRFRFAPPAAYPAVVEVATLDGHRAVWELAAPPPDGAAARSADDAGDEAADEATADVAPGAADGAATPTGVSAGELRALVDAAVARHVEPLREQLALAEERRRMSDVVGGVGYLLGLTGLVALMWRRKGG
jgi:nickel transport protein